jgi:hypothetical protein
VNGAPWNKIWRAPLLKNMHDLPAPPKVMDDMLFQMLAFLNAHGQIVFIPKNLVNYMIRSDSIINTISPEKLQTAYDAFLEVLRIYRESGASAILLSAFDALAFEPVRQRASPLHCLEARIVGNEKDLHVHHSLNRLLG